MPAVPSPWGIADVFAFQNNGTVTALTHAGVPAWSATAGPQTTLGLPDFQGGLVLAPQTNYPFLDSITKLDGLTGEAYPSYIPSTGTGLWYASPGIAIHTDGTIFAGLYADPDQNSGSFQGALVAIDPTTGSQKFSVPFSDPSSYVLAGPIVAGDGYAYAAYAYYDEDGVSQHLMLLRADSSGNTDNITIQDFTPPEGFFISLGANLMTNADAGVLLSWSEDFSQPLYRKPATAGPVDARNSRNTRPPRLPRSSAPRDEGIPPSNYGLAITTGTSVSLVSWATLTDQAGAVQAAAVVPALQSQSGSFVGYVWMDSAQYDMVSFTASGSALWTVPNEQPLVATNDGGVIGQSGVIYDQNGANTGQTSDLNLTSTPGWLGHVFGTVYVLASGAVSLNTSPGTSYANTFAAFYGGNPSGQGTAIKWVMSLFNPPSSAKQLPDLTGVPVCFPMPITLPFGYAVPTCGNINAIELLTNQSPDYIFQTYLQTFAPGILNPVTQTPRNPEMLFTGPANSNTINVTTSGQVLTISLQGTFGSLQAPFQIMTERVDPVARTISAVTLGGHPLAGWRYWRVYSIGTNGGVNDLVIETGAYDQPGPGPVNFAGYYVSKGTVSKGWQDWFQYIQTDLGATQGTNLTTLGGITPRSYLWQAPNLLKGYWDYLGDFTSYILNNVCQSTSCN